MRSLFQSSQERFIIEIKECNGMRIVVAGLGYVGAATAVMLASQNEVIALDPNEARVNSINERKSPIGDTLMDDLLVDGNLDLCAYTTAQFVGAGTEGNAYKGADFVFIATPTDYVEDKDSFDTSSVELVINDVEASGSNATIVIRSTVPIGFTEKLQDSTPNRTFLYCPEFLREGTAMQDMLHPERIVIGTNLESEESKSEAEKLASLMIDSIEQWKATCTGDVGSANQGSDTLPVVIMQSKEAEAVKLFANAYLAMRVSFFNELDTFAETNNISAERIINAVSLDKRIGDYYNNPSFGYGGYCLPKDTKQLLSNYANIPERIIKATVESNETRKEFIANQIMTQVGYLPNKRTNHTIGIYRLVMKSGSNNFRSSAVMDIIGKLRAEGLDVVIYEPTVSAIDDIIATLGVDSGIVIENDIEVFKRACDIIVANRYDESLSDVKGKVYTRDVYRRG